ncbi:unnamed protein product [Rotaria sp. Silwood2]|nr:unnamed protein product [Rotaria sp. Silwood2]
MCNVWGDPHILMLPQVVNGPRPQYWCRTEGEHLIYQSDYVRFSITITKIPFWKEQFTFIFSHDGAPFCILDSCGRSCKIKITTMSSTMYITYSIASLRIVIIRYDNAPFYDIQLIQRNFTIIRQSKGLCVHSSDICQSEKSSLLLARNRLTLYIINPTVEHYFVNEHAQEICNYYRQSAHHLAAQLNLPSISQTIEDTSMISCINDLESTGDRRFAKSIIQLLLMNTIGMSNIGDDQRELHFKKIDQMLETVIGNTSTMVEDFIWINATGHKLNIL